MKTYDDIIGSRRTEIYNEVQDIDLEIRTLKEKIASLESRKEFRIAEYNMLGHIKERGLIDDGRKTTRIEFEDAVKAIFGKVGRPLSIGELIDALEEFGYQWSTYQSAWYRLRSTKILEPTGARGYYNLIRVR